MFININYVFSNEELYTIDNELYIRSTKLGCEIRSNM